LLARRYPAASVTLVELQKSLAKLAQRNCELNSLADRVSVVHTDLKDVATADGRRSGSAGTVQAVRPDESQPSRKSVKPEDAAQKHEAVVVPSKLSALFTSETYDLVVANPPFRPLRTGKMSIADEKAIARHELALPLKDLIASAAFLLRHHGRFCFIHLPERLADIVTLLRANGFEPKRIRFVHSSVDTEAKMVLVEAVKNAKPGLAIERPLCLYNEDGGYTEEVLSLYQGDPT
jgi:tRNA1Val (adenine37-N6)-methyltransferase